MQITAVGLQMHNATRLKEITITVHEKRSGETLLLASYLRISKCNPYLRDLTRSEERLDELDACAQETYILESMLLSILGALPKAGTFDIDTDIVARWVAFSQINSIISFTTTELQHYRIVIAEEITAPASLHGMVTIQHLRRCRLDQASEGLVFTEFS